MPKPSLPLIPAALAVVQLLPAPDRVTVVARRQSVAATCPECGMEAGRVHSRYERALGDLPWQGRPVVLRVRARRFRCHHPACPRRTFAERIVGAAAACARRTGRIAALQRHLGFALGGEAGARLAGRLSIPASPDPASPDKLLRSTARTDAQETGSPPVPRVLAVDDWAWRRGTDTARCWSTSSATGSSISCPTGKPRRSRPGCAPTPGWR